MTLQIILLQLNEIANGAVTQAKINSGVALGAGYYIAKDGSVNGNASGRDNLFRVNLNATTGNVTILLTTMHLLQVPIDNW